MNYADVVGVFDESGAQVFTMARGMRLQTSRSSKTMQHPLEDGTAVVDQRVLLPIEAQLLVVLQAADYRDGYSAIQGIFASGQLLTVQCKVDSFANMYIAEMPHEETPDMFDAVQMVLKLVEAQFFKSQAQAATPRSSKSSSTTKRGEQSPKSSVAYDIFH